MTARCALIVVSCIVLALGCGDDGTVEPPEWAVVQSELPQALMSIWGTTSSDVWAVGADVPDDTEGPLVLHWDGTAWNKLATETTGDLWWVFGFANGPVYFGGKGGQILRYENGTFTPMTTPGTQTVFGIWGASPDDVWAVGADEGGQSGGFAWRLQGDTWVDAGLPASASGKAVWKIHGNSANDVWMVGTAGLVIHWNGSMFEEAAIGSVALFTVHCDGVRCAAVGGFASDAIFEHDGTAWRDASTPGDPPLTGVCLTSTTGFAVGDFGTVMARDANGAWSVTDDPVPTEETLHSIWVDPDGGIWTVGGRVRVVPLRDGVLAYRGTLPLTGTMQ